MPMTLQTITYITHFRFDWMILSMLSNPSENLWLLGLILSGSLVPGCARIMPTNAKHDESLSAAQIAEAGFLFESQGRTANAIDCFEKSLAMEPLNKPLQDKIAKLKTTPSVSNGPTSSATLDEVFSRHERSLSPKTDARTFTTSGEHFRTVSHTTVSEVEFDEIFVGEHTTIDSQDPAFDDWSR